MGAIASIMTELVICHDVIFGRNILDVAGLGRELLQGQLESRYRDMLQMGQPQENWDGFAGW